MWRMFWSVLASAGRLFLSPYLQTSWVLKNRGTSWKVQDAVWLPTFALPWQCFWWLNLVKDLQVQREVPGFHSKGSKDLHSESSHLKKSGVGRLDINRGTGSILCRPTKVLAKSWCLGLGSVFLKVKVYNVRGLTQHLRTVTYGKIVYSKAGH